MATETHDLMVLAKMLTGAAQEAIAEGSMPHMDPAVRLICYQIALSGNGDLPFVALYEKMYEYCAIKADQGPNFEYVDTATAVPPVYEPN